MLRAIGFFHYRFDSDEPQHLHVVWGWTAGLVQYRDVFDNHTPLFHILSAPLLAALGERAGILLYMRAAMLPLFAITIASTFFLGRMLYSARVGAWAATILSLFPTFFLKSLEFRNDNLCVALWSLALVLLVRRQITLPRAALAGILTGAALAASIKAVLLMFALVAAALVVRMSLSRIAALVAGFAVVPAATIAFFAWHGAVQELFYYSFTYNAEAGDREWVWFGRVVFPFAVMVLVFAAQRREGVDPLKMFAALIVLFFLVAVFTLWPLISSRDFLPVMPLVAIFGVAATDRVRWYAVAAALSIAAVVYYADGLRNRTDEHITMMNQVLRLTRPGEPLMDHKGETIYRRRPYFYGFETVTRERLRKGSIADTIPEDVIRARCYAAQADGAPFPPRGRRFLQENFLDLGRLRAAGQWIRDDGTFSIAIPGRYVVVNTDGPVQPPRELTAGTHRFERQNPGERVAVVWASAIERGLTPFHLRDRDF